MKERRETKEDKAVTLPGALAAIITQGTTAKNYSEISVMIFFRPAATAASRELTIHRKLRYYKK